MTCKNLRFWGACSVCTLLFCLDIQAMNFNIEKLRNRATELAANEVKSQVVISTTCGTNLVARVIKLCRIRSSRYKDKLLRETLIIETCRISLIQQISRILSEMQRFKGCGTNLLSKVMRSATCGERMVTCGTSLILQDIIFRVFKVSIKELI